MEQENHNLREIECPNCGFEVQADITTAITPGDQSLEQLFEGTLNQVVCDQCGIEFFCHTPLVFKTDEGDYVIYFNPEIAPLGYAEAEKQMKAALDASLADIPEHEKPECRLTLTRNEFIEKIALHLAELDDKIIEYLKFHIYSQEGLNLQSNELLFDFNRSDHEIIEFQVMDTVEGKLLYNTQTPVEAIEQIQHQLDAEDCPVNLEEVFSGLYVQVKKLLEK